MENKTTLSIWIVFIAGLVVSAKIGDTLLRSFNNDSWADSILLGAGTFLAILATVAIPVHLYSMGEQLAKFRADEEQRILQFIDEESD